MSWLCGLYKRGWGRIQLYLFLYINSLDGASTWQKKRHNLSKSTTPIIKRNTQSPFIAIISIKLQTHAYYLNSQEVYLL